MDFEWDDQMLAICFTYSYLHPHELKWWIEWLQELYQMFYSGQGVEKSVVVRLSWLS